MDREMPTLTCSEVPNNFVQVIGCHLSTSRGSKGPTKTWTPGGCGNQSTFCHWPQVGVTAKPGRFLEFLEILKRPGRSSMSRIWPSSNGPRPLLIAWI